MQEAQEYMISALCQFLRREGNDIAERRYEAQGNEQILSSLDWQIQFFQEQALILRQYLDRNPLFVPFFCSREAAYQYSYIPPSSIHEATDADMAEDLAEEEFAIKQEQLEADEEEAEIIQAKREKEEAEDLDELDEEAENIERERIIKQEAEDEEGEEEEVKHEEFQLPQGQFNDHFYEENTEQAELRVEQDNANGSQDDYWQWYFNRETRARGLIRKPIRRRLARKLPLYKKESRGCYLCEDH